MTVTGRTVLTGRRCALRRLTTADADAWLAGEDAEQRRWFEAPRPATRDDVVRYLGEIEAAWAAGGPKLHWGIWRAEHLAGGIDVDHRGDEAWLSYVVFPAHRRMGLAAESVGLIVDWAFANWRVTRVAAAIDEQNQASRRTVESVGFAFERLATEAEASESGIMLKYVLSHPVRA
jgi:RimJ/RimL family protein N-acetyltransferase